MRVISYLLLVTLCSSSNIFAMDPPEPPLKKDEEALTRAQELELILWMYELERDFTAANIHQEEFSSLHKAALLKDKIIGNYKFEVLRVFSHCFLKYFRTLYPPKAKFRNLFDENAKRKIISEKYKQGDLKRFLEYSILNAENPSNAKTTIFNTVNKLIGADKATFYSSALLKYYTPTAVTQKNSEEKTSLLSARFEQNSDIRPVIKIEEYIQAYIELLLCLKDELEELEKLFQKK